MEDWRRDFVETVRSCLDTAVVCERGSGQSKLVFDERLSRHTTFRIGGPAEVWMEVAEEETLLRVGEFCKQRGVPWWILGKGSNVLVSDAGLQGVVIHLVGVFRRIAVERDSEKKGVNKVLVRVGAGAFLDDIAQYTVECGLTGAEFLAGIPGTAGGALRTNAGAFGRMLSDILRAVLVLDTDGKKIRIEAEELGRCYRQPVIEAGLMALELELELVWGRGPSLDEIRQRRREKQPSEPSAGSFFKNPLLGGMRVPAGRLIEECGLKGRRIGGAQVSEKHANFIVNTGNAKAVEVYELAQIVRANVEEKKGVSLEPEVQVLP